MMCLADPGTVPPRVLVVDDNPGEVVLLREALLEARLPVTLLWAERQDAVLALVERSVSGPAELRIALILLDVNLAASSGLEILSLLRSMPPLDEVPIVAWTSSKADSDVYACYAGHANAFVTKPTVLDELVRTVRGVFGFWLPGIGDPGR